MAIKDILVYVDNSKICRTRIEAAINLAQKWDAHLIGLYVRRPPYLPVYGWEQVAEEILVAQEREIKEAADKAEKIFSDAVGEAGVTSEWRCPVGDAVEQISMHGRYADLAIIGQHDDDKSALMGENLSDRLVMNLGRSVLIIPYAGKFPKIGERIMVAWDASRQASRAVNDALPILEKADEVNVIAVNPDAGISGHGEIPCADICHHLARHGVKAEANSIMAKDIDVGDMLLSRAFDISADLIIMGAYGHTRFRELVLGGVTRHMLGHMTVPVLMSH